MKRISGALILLMGIILPLWMLNSGCLAHWIVEANGFVFANVYFLIVSVGVEWLYGKSARKKTRTLTK